MWSSIQETVVSSLAVLGLLRDVCIFTAKLKEFQIMIMWNSLFKPVFKSRTPAA